MLLVLQLWTLSLISDFLPDKRNTNGIAGILSTLGPVVGLFSGITPGGTATGAAGNILSALGAGLTQHVSNKVDRDFARQTFATQAKGLYNSSKSHWS